MYLPGSRLSFRQTPLRNRSFVITFTHIENQFYPFQRKILHLKKANECKICTASSPLSLIFPRSAHGTIFHEEAASQTRTLELNTQQHGPNLRKT